MAKKYKIFAGDVEFSYGNNALTNWHNLTGEEQNELREFVSRMEDNPNPEDACFHFEDRKSTRLNSSHP